jgi:predicted nucleic acid-binding protein
VTFVLDASATLTWLLSDAKAKDRDYAARLLQALKFGAVGAVPVTWALEISDGLPLATLDERLGKAARAAGVKRFSPR